MTTDLQQSLDADSILIQQVQEFSQRLCAAGIAVEMDQSLPMTEQFARLQEAVLHEIAQRRPQETLTQFPNNTFSHQQAAPALHESDVRFRTLVETSPDAITQTDLAGRIVACNAQTLRMHGYAQADELIGRPAFDLIAPEDRDVAAVNMLRTLEEGSTQNLQYTLLRKDGSRFPGELSVAVIADLDGAPCAFVAISRDISARIQAEAALRESETRYRELYQAITDALFIHEVFPDGTLGPFLEVNDVAVQRLGYTRDELLRLSPSEIDAKDADIDLALVMPKIIAGEDVIFEQVNQTKDGRRIPVEIHAHSFTWQGRRAVMSLVRDISARKQIESALARERAFLHAAIEILPLPLFFLDQQKRVIAVNATMRARMQQAGVTNVADILPLDPLTHQQIPDERRPTTRALRGEVVSAEEYLLAFPDTGVQMPCLEFAAPIYLDGEIAAIVFIAQDITLLKAADKAKDEFLATLSHELQTPLTSMLGWSEFALAREDTAFMREAMAVVHRNARRQKILIADMLDISRLLHGKLAIEPQVIDLGDLARQAVENIRYQASVAALTIDLQLPDTALPVVADPMRMLQCIDNLLHNSVKFTPAGGCITVSCYPHGAMVRLAVRDTGRGITPEMLGDIFNPFHQVERDERAGGLGLGLAVTRGLVELHHGQIWAESAGKDQGCTVTLTLPFAGAGTTGEGMTDSG